MSASLSLAIYFICWWVVLFAILPLRLGSQASESGHDPHAEASGAPQVPQLRAKFLITTIVSAAVFAVIYAVMAYRLVTLDSLPF